MAGTLTISTLSDGTNSTSSTNCIQGSAKAWVTWNDTATGGAQTILKSYNVSSVTDLGSSQMTVNFTNALPDVNYSVASSTTYGTVSTGARFFQPYSKATNLTTSCRFNTNSATAGNYSDWASAIFFD